VLANGKLAAGPGTGHVGNGTKNVRRKNRVFAGVHYSLGQGYLAICTAAEVDSAIL
jgi:hypothetical protein